VVAVKFAISCSNAMGVSPSAEAVLNFARVAEEIGFHTFVVADHVLMPNDLDASEYPAGTFQTDNPSYDPFVLLAAVAGVTKTIRLGTGIAVVPYRPPIQQAQAAATLDFISGGRLVYGAGVGWMRDEFDALGIPFAERGQRADEYIEVMKLLWSGNTDAYHGKFVDFAGGRLNPLPTQRPGPPVLIGGETPPALRRVAKLGDGLYINWKSVEKFRDVLAQLDTNMAGSGRDARDLYKQMGATDISLVRQADIAEYEAMGLDEIVFCPRCASPEEGVAAMRGFAREFFGTP
jgi:probable F420-dependent oxidoreductase